jgi:long-subunit acyl-CoA synthetase (AMP-forming)
MSSPFFNQTPLPNSILPETKEFIKTESLRSELNRADSTDRKQTECKDPKSIKEQIRTINLGSITTGEPKGKVVASPSKKRSEVKPDVKRIIS